MKKNLTLLDITGTALLSVILLTIVILFTFYGNGQYSANIVLR